MDKIGEPFVVAYKIGDCECVCHKPEVEGGWNSETCCPDCGNSLIDYDDEDYDGN